MRVGLFNKYVCACVSFRNRSAEVQQLSPNYGPQAGGTLLSIKGRRLNIGRTRMLRLEYNGTASDGCDKL